ncbi:SRPBCC domain-containing protein [Streptomyces sp. C]|uniref:SRPBCC domain-containing protein n=1 Tax=Streptomyces sp. C TaxID=253839 RepID=UPI0001DEFA51|nr:SRPBCC domain-containing protein [Streptomyces sp. C]EFL19759.1 predicted protein [Streptomyces sp. C]
MSMENRRLTHAPAAHACMVVRRPAAEAFRAFADPAVTSRFWYGKSSGPMVTGSELRWEWETYGTSADVRVHEVQKGRLIRFEWGNYGQPTKVELKFTPHTEQVTFVEVTETGSRARGTTPSAGSTTPSAASPPPVRDEGPARTRHRTQRRPRPPPGLTTTEPSLHPALTRVQEGWDPPISGGSSRFPVEERDPHGTDAAAAPDAGP